MWVFVVKSFPSSSSISCRFYYNEQQDLTQPLLLKTRAETLQDKGIGGIIYSLSPDSSSAEIVQQLPPDVVGEVIDLLYDTVDSDEVPE